MKVVIGNWFNLPRLGTDVFSALMKAGVKYEKGMGFMLAAETDIGAASRTIEKATGESVELSVRCFVCAREACPSCSLRAICDRRTVSPACLCEEHFLADDAYEVYVKTFEAGLAE
jgi:hypothetical protein